MNCEAEWIIMIPDDVIPLSCNREAGHEGSHRVSERIGFEWDA